MKSIIDFTDTSLTIRLNNHQIAQTYDLGEYGCVGLDDHENPVLIEINIATIKKSNLVVRILRKLFC